MIVKRVSSGLAALLVALVLSIGACLSICTEEAEAATNASASAAIDSIQTQTYYKPGGSCPSGTNVGWLINGSWNCDNECYAFARGVAMKLYGNHSFITGVGTYGYKVTSPGSYKTVGTLTGAASASPSLGSVQTLMQKAYPGDLIQFKGGPSGWGSLYHTAVVESVDSGGVTIYEHVDDAHVRAKYHSWSYFYNTYLDFDCSTSYTKGITLYHYGAYEQVFPSHKCDYTKEVYATFLSKATDYDICHNYSYQKACSCGKVSSTKYTGLARCTWEWVGLTYQCAVCGQEYTPGQRGEYGEFVSKRAASLYSDTALSNAVSTIPANTVVDVEKIEANGKKWYAAVSYGGKSGYIAMSDFMFNGTAGRHSFSNGSCTECGIKQVPDEPGVYVSTEDIVVYKTDVYSSSRKTISAGTPITVSSFGVTTWGYRWGYTPDGYVFELMDLTGKVSDYPHNGTQASVTEGTYYIHTASNYSLVCDIEGGGTTDRTPVQIYTSNSSPAQQFNFISNGDGTYRIQNVKSGKVVEAKGWSKVDYGAIQQYAWTGDDNQRWYVEKNPDGTYSFRNKISNLYLDVPGHNYQDGIDLIQYHPSKSLASNQRFVLERIDGSGRTYMDSQVVELSGVESAYAYTGEAISPQPEVKKLVAQHSSIRVPKTGVSPWYNCNETGATVEAGKTYEIQVGSVENIAGNFTQVRIVPIYKKDSVDCVGGDVAVLDVSSEKQTKRVTITNDSTLEFYTAYPVGPDGTAAAYYDVRVYEVLKEGVDYELSYEDNIEVGTATVTAAGMGNFAGQHIVKFQILESEVDEPEPPVVGFTDVPEGSWFFNPVAWAVSNGITSGLSATEFGPDMTCTRAQAVTFLWNAAGKPAPSSTAMPFTDVADGAWYRDAVLWAVENGVTAGTSATTFGPDVTCTRAQIVTFLWNSEGKPAPEVGTTAFVDVPADAWYRTSVLWAVENGVTSGTSATTFSPDTNCTRAQIVTFLYNYMAG